MNGFSEHDFDTSRTLSKRFADKLIYLKSSNNEFCNMTYHFVQYTLIEAEQLIMEGVRTGRLTSGHSYTYVKHFTCFTAVVIHLDFEVKNGVLKFLNFFVSDDQPKDPAGAGQPRFIPLLAIEMRGLTGLPGLRLKMNIGALFYAPKDSFLLQIDKSADRQELTSDITSNITNVAQPDNADIINSLNQFNINFWYGVNANIAGTRKILMSDYVEISCEALREIYRDQYRYQENENNNVAYRQQLIFQFPCHKASASEFFLIAGCSKFALPLAADSDKLPHGN